MNAQAKPENLNKNQLEILKLFSRDLSDAELKEIKHLIVQYLAKKTIDLADRKWEEKSWTNEDMDRLLKNHQRTPYNSKN